MQAGLPGTGLGGLLYLVLVALMPIHELWMLVRGRSSVARWKNVSYMVAMGAGIVFSLTATWWVIEHGFGWLEKHSATNSVVHHSSVVGSHTVVPALAYLPFIILAFLVLALHVLAFILHRKRIAVPTTATPPAKIAAPAGTPEAA